MLAAAAASGCPHCGGTTSSSSLSLSIGCHSLPSLLFTLRWQSCSRSVPWRLYCSTGSDTSYDLLLVLQSNVGLLAMVAALWWCCHCYGTALVCAVYGVPYLIVNAYV